MCDRLYQCHRPVLLVADPEMIKEIFIKEFSNFTNRSVSLKTLKYLVLMDVSKLNLDQA